MLPESQILGGAADRVPPAQRINIKRKFRFSGHTHKSDRVADRRERIGQRREILAGDSYVTLLGPLWRRCIVFLGCLILVAGCASTAPEESDPWAEGGDDGFAEASDNDPLETPNRFMFAFNEALDVVIFQPAAATYRFLLPSFMRDMVQSFTRNLRTPVTLANDLFQGDLDRAETTMARFMLNTVVGVGGLFDVAADSGHPYHSEDFGQTLATYGAGEGFYLVLPILGPSSLRDGGGSLVDSFLDPLTYVAPQEFLLGRRVAEGIDTRSRNIETIEEIKRDSIDFYARVRSLYRQRREAEINNGAPQDGQIPGLSQLTPANEEAWND